MDRLKEAIEFQFDLNLWPPSFVKGASFVAAKRRLCVDSVILAEIVGTAAFIGKTQIQLEGSDRVEVASLWVLNVQVKFCYSSLKLFYICFNKTNFFNQKSIILGKWL